MKRRSFHPTPHSRIDHHVERAGDMLNSLFLYGILGSVFALLILSNQPYKQADARTNRHASVEREVTEEEYLVAVSSAKTSAVKLTEEQVAEMDMWAAKATNPDDVKKLKPKAKAVYYATLNRQQVASLPPSDFRRSAFDILGGR